MDSTPQKKDWWSDFLEHGTGQIELSDVDECVEDSFSETSDPDLHNTDLI